MVAVGGICGAMLSPFRFFRYVVPVLPLVLALGAIGLSALGAGGRLRQSVAAAIVVAVATSTAPLVWSHALMTSMARTSGVVRVRPRIIEYRVPLAELVGELRDPPRGPIAATVEYLRKHAGPDDVVVTSYGELPLKFHTRLTIYGGETAQLPPAGVSANWLWPRHLGSYREVRASRTGSTRNCRDSDLRAHRVARRRSAMGKPGGPGTAHLLEPWPDGPPVVIYRAVE